MSAGDIQAKSTVLLFPPKESSKSLVNFESLYGIWFLCSLNAAITFPKLNKPLLILIPNFIIKTLFLSLSYGPCSFESFTTC